MSQEESDVGFRKVPLAIVCRVNGRGQIFWAESREKSRVGARKGWGCWTRAEMWEREKLIGRQNVKSAEQVRLGSREMCR